MASDPDDVRAAIEAQFVEACAACGRIVESTGFRVHLWTTADAFYRDVAVPIDRPADWTGPITAMAASFEAAGRRPALEYLEERWPDLAPGLVDAGFVREQRLTAMVRDSGAALRSSGGGFARPGYRFWALRHLDGSTPEPRLHRYLEALHEAFEPRRPVRVEAREVAGLRRALARGRMRICVVEDTDGAAIAGANLIGIDRVAGVPGPVAELSGVWTAAAMRGRGLGRAVASALLKRFFDEDCGLAWLAAENARATAFYARLGFRPIGHQLRYSRRTA